MGTKRPYFEFYPGDWMKDFEVRFCSIFARGLLIDILCLMHVSKSRGRLCHPDGVSPLTDEEIAGCISGGSPEEKMLGIAELVSKGALSRDSKGVLFSRRMVHEADVSEKRAVAGSKKGSKTQANNEQNSSKTQAKGPAKINQNAEDDNEDEDEGISSSPKKETARQIPPTLEAVTAYCFERKNGINPQAFINHYAAKGWRIGKERMKDWQAAVRTWEANQAEKATKATHARHNPGETKDSTYGRM